MATKLYYRTKDGMADYQFSIERRSNGRYRSYILSQPSYGSRSTRVTTIHRMNDGRPHICFEPEPTTEADARKVIAAWCDMTQEYIRTGRSIDEQRAQNRQR